MKIADKQDVYETRGQERKMPIARYKFDLKEVLFCFYCFAVLSASIVGAISDGDRYGLLLFFFLVVYTSISITPKVRGWVQGLSLEATSSDAKTKIKVFSIASGIFLFMALVYFLGIYPGCFENDSIDQYAQAITGNYNDWHPVWHTILAFTLPLKLTGVPASIILFQIFFFSLLFGYMALTFYVFAGPVFTWVVTILLLLCPFTFQILMYAYKDNAFSMAALASMLFSAQIYLTEGKWCRKPYRIVLLASMLACTTLFRHNGILLSLPLLIALFPVMQRKKWLLTTVMTVLIILLIRGPLYSHLGVRKPDKRILETTGLPLSIILSVSYKCPEKLDERVSLFVDDLMSVQPDWKSSYHMSGFNSVKSRGINNDAIERLGFFGIFQLMLNCFAKAPLQSFMSFVRVTIPVYGLEIPFVVEMGISDNDFGINYQGIQTIQHVAEFYSDLISKTPVRILFSCIGTTILIMLAFMLFKTDFKRKEELKRFFLCTPILVYDFATMLLLSGHDVRFFFASFLVCPVVVLLMGSSRTS